MPETNKLAWSEFGALFRNLLPPEQALGSNLNVCDRASSCGVQFLLNCQSATAPISCVVEVQLLDARLPSPSQLLSTTTTMLAWTVWAQTNYKMDLGLVGEIPLKWAL